MFADDRLLFVYVDVPLNRSFTILTCLHGVSDQLDAIKSIFLLSFVCVSNTTAPPTIYGEAVV